MSVSGHDWPVKIPSFLNFDPDNGTALRAESVFYVNAKEFGNVYQILQSQSVQSTPFEGATNVLTDPLFTEPVVIGDIPF